VPIFPTTPVLWGVDVASYHSGIDFAATPTVDFAIVKATEGRGYRNPAMAAQMASAKAAGKLTGLYHFVSAGNSVEDEVANFLATAASYTDFIPVLDFEPADRSRTDWAAAWLDQVQAALGVRPWIYMDQSTSLREWPGVKGRTPLWLARYPARPSTVLGQLPDDSWTAPGWDVVAWQYTADGRVPGWGGILDLNVYYGDHASWARYCVRRTHTPPTPPAPDLTLTTWRGGRFTGDVKASLEELNRLTPTIPIVVTQGGWNEGIVGSSAGTHDRDAVDVAAASLTPEQRAEVVRLMRMIGWAAWLRTPAQGFPWHVHGVPAGWGLVSPTAARQVVDYLAGRNGLANKGPDDGPRDYVGVTWPDYRDRDRLHTPYPDQPAAQQEDDMLATYRETNGTIWASNGSGSTGLSPDEAAAVHKAKTGADLTADEVRAYQDVEARLAPKPAAAAPTVTITADDLAAALLKAGTVTVTAKES